MRGAVMTEVGGELEIVDDIELVAGPGRSEVRVEIKATGICHSDLSAIDGILPAPEPCVIGHEAAGIVTEVGADVETLAVGDHVIFTLIPPCGRCRYCLGGQANLCDSVVNPFDPPPRYERNGEPLFTLGGIGTWTEQAVVHEQGLVKIADSIPFDVAAIVGCAVTTGVGAVLNTAALRPGSTVAVFGCGGVGMSVIQGARLAGATDIVAIDMNAEKLELAKSLGATATATPGQLTAVGDAIHDGLGFDCAFEVIGRGRTIRDAYDSTRRGGTMVVVGAGGMDDMVEFSAFELFFFERTIKGCVYGSADPRAEFGRILDLWRVGRLDLDALITRRLKLDEINDGVRALREGTEIRQVVIL